MREGQFFLQKGMDFAKGDGINKGEGTSAFAEWETAFGAGRKRRAQPEHFVKKKACNLKKSGYSRRCPCRGRLSAAIH